MSFDLFHRSTQSSASLTRPLICLMPVTDKTNVFLLGVVAVVIVLLPRSFWWPIFGKVVLPVLQLSAVSVGWLLGRYVLLGEWPLERYELWDTLSSRSY